MENQVWQEIPGDPGYMIYPYLRKPDVISSNSYIIADDKQVIAIDPGGLAEQALHLVNEINRLLEEQERPVFFLLTHSHLDHCLQLLQALDVHGTTPASLITHTLCADALEGKDIRATVADLMGYDMNEITVGARLFCESGQDLHFAACNPAGILRIAPSSRTGSEPTSQTITTPSGNRLTCYQTPGHTPDSISINIGHVLFLGDILFAASPGVAGLHGWNHQDLIESAAGLIHVIGNRGITLCCPGHGRVIPAGQAETILRSIQEEASKLAGIRTISPDRACMMAEYASDIMSELDRLFTIIAGRLLFVTYILEELEEAEEAERLRSAIDPQFIDQMLEEFGQFSRDYREGGKKEIHVALKAGQITAKLASCYDRGALAKIIDPSFIRRVDRLLRDYSVTFRGFDVVPDLEKTDMGELADELMRSLTERPYDEETILDAADDSAYLAALVARISHVNPLESLKLSTWRNTGTSCCADRGRASDLLRHIVELYAVYGAKQVMLSTNREGQNLVIRVLSPECDHIPLDERGWRFLLRSATLSGGDLIGPAGKELMIAFRTLDYIQ